MIKNLIRQYREQKNLTQQQPAEAVGVSRQTVIAMEKGNYEPPLGLALKLAKFFKMPVEEIFMLK